jgi:hypothetical protein
MTNTKIEITEYNCETGIETTRDATTEEVAQMQLDAAAYAARKAEAQAKATQKAALLERLGITEDEARLLLA